MAELLVPEVNLSANGEVTFYKVVSSSVNQEDFAINGIHQSNKEKYKNKGFDFDCIFEKANIFLVIFFPPASKVSLVLFKIFSFNVSAFLVL